MAKRPPRPRDPNQLAKLITEIATGERENVKPAEPHPARRKGGLAQAGDWAEFFALCPESGNPDGAEGLRACLLLWAEMRQNLGLPTGIPN